MSSTRSILRSGELALLCPYADQAFTWRDRHIDHIITMRSKQKYSWFCPNGASTGCLEIVLKEGQTSLPMTLASIWTTGCVSSILACLGGQIDNHKIIFADSYRRSSHRPMLRVHDSKFLYPLRTFWACSNVFITRSSRYVYSSLPYKSSRR